jgi:hypothetical protein
LNLFKKPFKGFEVILETSYPIPRRYKAITTDRPIEVWHPVLCEFDERSSCEKLVDIGTDESYKITATSTTLRNCSSFSIVLRGGFRTITLWIRINGYLVSWSDLRTGYLPLSAINIVTEGDLSPSDSEWSRLSDSNADITNDKSEKSFDAEEFELDEGEIFDLMN